MAKKKEKIKIPKSVLDLRLSPKRFAKKHNIKLTGKGISKREKKRNRKRLRHEYSECALSGLNKAVKILAENSPENKKVLKVKDGVDNIILNSEVMKQVAKLYRKSPDNYPHMIFLPHMIMNTLLYYQSDNISDDEKDVAKKLEAQDLIVFCEKILKKEIKRYRNMGLEDSIAYQMATVVPTTKMFRNNRTWYKRLIQQLYQIAAESEIDIDMILKAITKIDKKKGIDKKDFVEGFYSEFILTKSSNKSHSYNDSQKELHERLIEKTLDYLDGLKGRKLREILKTYIKRRKTAESYKNDTKRVIKFIDHAHSNSSFTNIKAVVQDLVADNSANELYLS